MIYMSHLWFIHSSGYVGYFTIEKNIIQSLVDLTTVLIQ